MRVGLVGMDSFFFSTSLLRTLQDIPDVELVGCCDLGVGRDEVKANAGEYPEQLARRFNVTLFHSLEEMLERSDVEGVCVATRPSRVVTILPLLVDRGIHCYLVKPAVTQEEDLNHFASLLKTHPGIVVSGMTGRLDPVIKETKERIDRGDIDQPVSLRVMHQHGKLSAWPKTSWYFEETESPPVITLGWYCIDLLSWLADSPITTVYTEADRLADMESPHVDYIKSICRMESGALASLDIYFGVTWPYPELDIEVIGKKSALHATRAGLDGQWFTQQGPIGYGRSMIDLLEAEIVQWVGACLGEHAPFILKDEIVQNLQACLALQRSITYGKLKVRE